MVRILRQKIRDQAKFKIESAGVTRTANPVRGLRLSWSSVSAPGSRAALGTRTSTSRTETTLTDDSIDPEVTNSIYDGVSLLFPSKFLVFPYDMPLHQASCSGACSEQTP